MPRIRKTRDALHLYVNYGHGWEHEVTEYRLADIKARVREYRENCPEYPVKWGFRRERIEAEEFAEMARAKGWEAPAAPGDLWVIRDGRDKGFTAATPYEACCIDALHPPAIPAGC